jgi:predicted enzyme related to lactoylglutathione lyase
MISIVAATLYLSNAGRCRPGADFVGDATEIGPQGETEMTNPIAHFEIMGKDAIRLQAFYATVFNWKLSPPMPEMGNYSLFDNEGAGIGGGIGEGDPRVTVYIRVADLQAYKERVTQAGGQMLMPATQVTDTVTIALFADPAGNIIGLLRDTST